MATAHEISLNSVSGPFALNPYTGSPNDLNYLKFTEPSSKKRVIAIFRK